MTDRKAVIKNADMSEDMQQDAVDCATQAIEKYNIEKVWQFNYEKVRQTLVFMALMAGYIHRPKQNPTYY